MKKIHKQLLTLSLALIIGLSAFAFVGRFENDSTAPVMKIFGATSLKVKEKE